MKKMFLVAALAAAVAVLATYWIMKPDRGAQYEAPKPENGKGASEVYQPTQKNNPANMAKGKAADFLRQKEEYQTRKKNMGKNYSVLVLPKTIN